MESRKFTWVICFLGRKLNKSVENFSQLVLNLPTKINIFRKVRETHHKNDFDGHAINKVLGDEVRFCAIAWQTARDRRLMREWVPGARFPCRGKQ